MIKEETLPDMANTAMTETAIARRRRDPAAAVSRRRESMLDAAAALFLERGFAGTSLAAVVERSGGSLATLYAAFDNKRGLLEAVMQRERETHLADLGAVMAAEASARSALKLLARRLHSYLNAPRSLAMMRIAIAESLRDPDFARDFYCRGRDDRCSELADILAGWADAGTARIDDPKEAASLFIAATLSDIQINAMVASENPECPSILARRLDWRVDRYCDGFGIA